MVCPDGNDSVLSTGPSTTAAGGAHPPYGVFEHQGEPLCTAQRQGKEQRVGDATAYHEEHHGESRNCGEHDLAADHRDRGHHVCRYGFAMAHHPTEGSLVPRGKIGSLAHSVDKPSCGRDAQGHRRDGRHDARAKRPRQCSVLGWVGCHERPFRHGNAQSHPPHLRGT